MGFFLLYNFTNNINIKVRNNKSFCHFFSLSYCVDYAIIMYRDDIQS